MLTIFPHTFKTLQYKLDDVAPVSLAMYTHHVLSVGPAVPDSVKTLKEFFAWAKANPDKAAYGSPGAGSMPHLVGVLLAKAGGTELRHVAYRGSAPGIQDLLGGQIASFVGPAGDVIAHAKNGKVRVLGVSGKERDVLLPAVLTMREQGFPMALREWYAFFMPAKASADMVQRASAALQQAIAQADVVEFGKQFGLEMQASSPRQLADCSRPTPPSGAASPSRPGSPPTREPGAARAPHAKRSARQPVGRGRAPRRQSLSALARRRSAAIRRSSPSGWITGQGRRRSACSSRSASPDGAGGA